MGSNLGSAEEGPEPPALRRLRRLVTTLTAVLILGVITVVGLLVIRLAQLRPSQPALPAALSLPAGETPGAVTFGTGWVAVVTRDAEGRERIRVMSPDGAPLGDMEIVPRPAP